MFDAKDVAVVAVVWSLQGGSGCSVVAALLALHWSRSSSPGSAVVDLGGDQPAVLGCEGGTGPGIADWLASDRQGDDQLARLVHTVGPGLGLLSVGTRPWPEHTDAAGSVRSMFAQLDAQPSRFVVDAGSVIGIGGPRGAFVSEVVRLAPASILVVRACYLNLRRIVSMPTVPSKVVLLAERGRALGVGDVEQALGLPVSLRLEMDASVSRAVDAGLLLSRPLPRLDRAMRTLT
ncbi:MAG: hypothetical protein ACR2PK_03500 [Acidimicrobiales bacterium]